MRPPLFVTGCYSIETLEGLEHPRFILAGFPVYAHAISLARAAAPIVPDSWPKAAGSTMR